MKNTLVILSLAAFTFSVLTARAEDSVTLLKCPAIPETYNQMLTELNLLKTAIKRDAACESVSSEVESLEKLLGDRRKNVLELIKKNKEEPLTEAEIEEVRLYVEDMTKKVFSTAELLNRNNYCFAEDRKQFGLAELASLTLDATAIARAIPGPWSAPIAIGGTVLAGIMQGLDSVVKSRRGYDFEKLEQRQSFVQSLCTYYNYRQDIEHLLFPRRRAAQIAGLKKELRNTLQGMTANCDGCARISRMASESGDVAPNSVMAINSLAKETDATYVKPLGTYTVQAINSLRWAEGEMHRLEEDAADEASIGRDLVSEMKADIDRFIFERESPRFVAFQNRKAAELFGQFQSHVMEEGNEILLATFYILKPSSLYQPLYRMSEPEAIKTLTDLVPELQKKGQDSLVYRIQDYERRARDLLERAALAMDVQLAYCDFFRRAGVYNRDLQESCDSAMAGRVQKNLLRLENMIGPNLIPVRPKNGAVDWADGLTAMLKNLNQDPGTFRRR